MFDQLVESRPRRERTAGGMLVSVVVHGVMITGAAIATSSVAEPPSASARDTTLFVMRPPPLQVVQVQQSRITPLAVAQPQGFQVIDPPDRIPTDIPPVELSERFDASRFSGHRIDGGAPGGVPWSPAPDSVLSSRRFTIDQVDVPAVYLGGAAPRRAALSGGAPVGRRRGACDAGVCGRRRRQGRGVKHPGDGHHERGLRRSVDRSGSGLALPARENRRPTGTPAGASGGAIHHRTLTVGQASEWRCTSPEAVRSATTT